MFAVEVEMADSEDAVGAAQLHAEPDETRGRESLGHLDEAQLRHACEDVRGDGPEGSSWEIP